MNVMFCGGGTVGHVSPALAIANEFKKTEPSCKIGFIGRLGGYENEIIRKNGFEIYEIQISGLERKLTLRNLKVIKNVFAAEKETEKILKSFKADAVIGTGGYVCFPVIRAASKLGIFTAIHESNATLGLSAKMLLGKCDVVFLGSKSVPKRKNSVYSGNPVREAFYKISKKEARALLKIPSDAFFILSVGGSIGADALNNASLEMMRDFSLKNDKIWHYHSSGKRYFEKIKAAYPDTLFKNKRCTVFPYIDKMELYLAAADLVITRCGAMTLAETAASKSASILIPSPNVTANHQTKNALSFVENGAGILINESELSAPCLIAETKKLLEDREALNKMGECAYSFSSPNSAKEIVSTVKRHLTNC